MLRETPITLCKSYRSRFLRRRSTTLRDNDQLEAPNVRRTLHREDIFRGYGERERGVIPPHIHSCCKDCDKIALRYVRVSIKIYRLVLLYVSCSRDGLKSGIFSQRTREG